MDGRRSKALIAGKPMDSAPRPLLHRIILGCLILSTLLVYFFWGAKALFEKNQLPLPFGFTYCLGQEKDSRCGKVQSLNAEAVQAIFAAAHHGDLLVLNSWIRSSEDKSVRLFFAGTGNSQLTANGGRSFSFSGSIQRLPLKKGYNEITIQYQSPGDEQPQLTFSLSDDVPFYDFILPRHSASKILSPLLSVLDHWKLAIFVLTFIVLVGKLGLAALAIPSKAMEVLPNGSASGFFRAFSFFLVFGPWGIYLNHALRLGVPDFVFLGAGLIGSLGIVLASVFRKKRNERGDRRSLIVLALIILFVFLHIYLDSGSLLPPPNQLGDLPTHMQMMRHYQDTGDFLRENPYGIYPQGIHAWIALTAKTFRLPLQESVIVFLAFVMIMIYFLIYRLSQDLFGRSHFVYFFGALSLSHFRFIYEAFFHSYSFPSLVAILFFLLSLHFFLRTDLVPSSIALAGAVITYPYYAFFFFGVTLILALGWLKEHGRTPWQKWRRSLYYFSTPLVSFFVYGYHYWTFGFSQQEQGFRTAFKVNPFLSMQIINALLLLIGVHALLKEGNNRRAMRFVLGAVAGFLVYFIPYYFFSFGSTYYFIKNMQYVILLSIPLEIVALDRMFHRFERTVWVKPAVFLGAAGIFVLRIIKIIPF